eukprot:1156601-Pelagomonas_calceolata.AAC.3
MQPSQGTDQTSSSPALRPGKSVLPGHLAQLAAKCTPDLNAASMQPFPLHAGLDAFRLVAMEQLTATCKSVVIAAALLHGRLTPAEAFEASRLEETMQIEEWGMVGGRKDVQAPK